MWYILNPLHHMRAVQEWANTHEAHLHLSAQTWSLTLTRGKHVERLVPRFVVQRNGQPAYVRVFDESANFAGWHPQHQESWPLAQDKLAFKRQASAMGLRVPTAWTTPEPLVKNFLVKSRAGSFGSQVHGPFTTDTRNPTEPLEPSAYFEEFVSGRSAKAWCLNGEVIVLELIEAPYIVGDGLRSLNELAAQRGNVGRALPLDKCANMLLWQGLTRASVPRPEQKVLLDFKYATPFDAPIYGNRNVWAQQDGKIQHQFARAAKLLQAFLPAAVRTQGMFTLDAVVDEEGRAWFLEMNSHPMVHPDVYALMLSTLMKLQTRPVSFS